MDENEHPLRRYRREHEITLDELAAVAETSAVTVSRIERRQRRPAVPLLIRLSEATGLSIEELARASGCEEAAD